MIKLGNILNEIKVVRPPIPKTIEWWLYQLPEPIRTQAMTNYKKETDESMIIYRTLTYNHLYEALNVGFNWWGTPEGSHYWWEIHYKLRNNEPLTEIKISKPISIKFVSKDDNKRFGDILFGEFKIFYKIKNEDEVYVGCGYNEGLLKKYTNYTTEWGILPRKESEEVCEKLLPYFKQWGAKIKQDDLGISNLILKYDYKLAKEFS